MRTAEQTPPSIRSLVFGRRILAQYLSLLVLLLVCPHIAARQPSGPLTFRQLADLLDSDTPEAILLAVEERGLAFVPQQRDLERLHSLGASKVITDLLGKQRLVRLIEARFVRRGRLIEPTRILREDPYFEVFASDANYQLSVRNAIVHLGTATATTSETVSIHELGEKVAIHELRDVRTSRGVTKPVLRRVFYLDLGDDLYFLLSLTTTNYFN